MRLRLCALAAPIAALAFALAGSALPAQAMPKLYECQHPLVTGEEAYDLEHVSAATACPVVRALAKWEYHPISHVHDLYVCVGAGRHTPKLVLRSFDGWKLSIHEGLRMSRGESSFQVTGTDFPLNCS